VNLALMRWLVGSFEMNYLVANILAIAAGGVANYLVSDRLVFLSRRAS
jgi:putative flippase GtrA